MKGEMHEEMMEEKSEGKKKKIEDYEIDSACEALMRAEEIKGNKELMALVQKKLSKKKSAIKSIQDIRDKAANMDESSDT